MPIQITPEQLQAIARWAEDIHWITEVWLFGSRARGTARPDSDFDIAVTIKGGARTGNTSAVTLWHFDATTWKSGLRAALDNPVSFLPFDDDTKHLTTDAVMVWSRLPASDRF